MSSLPVPGSKRARNRGPTIVALRARPLASASPHSSLPDWAHAALRPTPGRWPENLEQFVLEVEAADATLGWYGPCSATTVRVIGDQVAPAVMGSDLWAYRATTRRGLLGRHVQGAHVQVAVSAVRLAVVDLLSRQTGVAVCALFGGPTRSHVPAYASALGVDIDHPLASDVAVWLVEQGYYGQKWALRGFARGEEPDADAARLTRIRQAVGPDVPIMVDVLGQWSVDYAIRMTPALARMGIAWIEEPFDVARIAELHRIPGCVPIAAGEHAYDQVTQLAMIEGGHVDVWQPDVGWHGGLLDALTMVDLADAHGLRVFPHGGCLAGAVALAGLTDAAVLPAVEYHLTQEPVRQQVLTEPIVPGEGKVPVRDGVGFVDGYRTVSDARAVLLTGGRDGLG